jgi:hypothetical protein
VRPAAAALGLAAWLAAAPAAAFEWMDNAIGYRYGTQYREPANPRDITKNILSFTHVDGYEYGGNFLNIDWLVSNPDDPKKYPNGDGPFSGAEEIYIVYRHELSLSKISGKEIRFGVVKDVGIKFGIDLNTKNDAFQPRVRKPMAGVNFSFDVPGFLNVGLLVQDEHNHNGIVAKDVNFKKTGRLETNWGIPFNLGSIGAKFQGFLNYNGSKGLDGFGAPTAPETLLETSVMFDLGVPVADLKKGAVFFGVGYQYWRNKFGSNHYTDPSGGSFAKAPQLQAELHF